MRIVSILTAALLLLSAFAVFAQDQPVEPPTISATEINRANELAYIQSVRNGRNPNVLALLYAPTLMAYNPFNPMGVEATNIQSALDEAYFQSAYTYIFSEWLILAEGDSTGMYLYQEGDMVGEYFGTPPTNQQSAGWMLAIDTFQDGKQVEQRTAWDQAGFLEGLGWATVDYPNVTQQPLGLVLGTTGSTPADHHAVLDQLYAAFCAGCTLDTASVYADTAIVHDYLETYTGSAAIGEQIAALQALPGLAVEDSHSVCEGNMCISYVTLNVTQSDQATPLIWAAVQRFEDGKIAEEWWEYDNSVLWSFLPPEA